MKILAIGDPHFKVDNAEESEHFHRQLERWLSEHDPLDFIVILGDILHSHEKIYTYAMNTAVKFIKMCSTYAPVWCLVGNHDATSNTIYCGSNHWLHVLDGASERIHIVEKPVWVTPHIVACPYVSDGRFIEMCNEFLGDGKVQDASLIFAHQLFNGGKMGAIVASNVEEWPEEWPMIVSGHLHDRQQPQPNLYYTGSSQQTAFSESGDKSLCLLSVDDTGEGEVKLDEIFLELKQRKTLYASLKELEDIVDKIKEFITYKIVVKDSDDAIKAYKKTAKYKELIKHPQIRSVQFKPMKEETPDEPAREVSDFLMQLQARLSGENPYLQSYASHMLTNAEDLSNKDIVLI